MKITLVVLVLLGLVALSSQEIEHHAHACEGQTLRLLCRLKYRIHVHGADYGRWSTDTCPYYDDPNMRTDCHSEHALKKLRKNCNKRMYCSITADNDFFGDPCPGQIKYAVANYTCVKRMTVGEAIAEGFRKSF